jgi:hypothetical protein
VDGKVGPMSYSPCNESGCVLHIPAQWVGTVFGIHLAVGAGWNFGELYCSVGKDLVIKKKVQRRGEP